MSEHYFDETSVINPVTGKPYGPGPLWAGTEPMDYPDPLCVCGELWSEDEGGCPVKALENERDLLRERRDKAIKRLARYKADTFLSEQIIAILTGTEADWYAKYDIKPSGEL